MIKICKREGMRAYAHRIRSMAKEKRERERKKKKELVTFPYWLTYFFMNE
jgi:hypothetical protein